VPPFSSPPFLASQIAFKMAKGFSLSIIAVIVFFAVSQLQQSTFVPPPVVHRSGSKLFPIATATAAGVAGAAPAFADKIDDAAKKLTDAAYPLMQKIDWDSDIYAKAPPGLTSKQVLNAIDKVLVMGASMDSVTLNKAVEAHHQAIVNLGDKSGVLAKPDFLAINAALGHAIAKTPKNKVMDVYYAFNKLISPDVGKFLLAKVGPETALPAYAGFIAFVEKSFGVKNALQYPQLDFAFWPGFGGR